MRLRRTVPLAAAGLLLYSVGYERTAYTLRTRTVPVLPPGSAPLTVLHLSDLHVTPRQHGKVAWLRDLARLTPDLVVVTGDLISHQAANPVVLQALEPLFSFPGAFVPGNNDYYAPQLKSPLRYFRGREEAPRERTPLDWPQLAAGLAAAGWTDLTNVRTTLKAGGAMIDARGIDDPYTRRDDLAAVAGPGDPSATLRLGVTHAPEPRVLDAFTRDGCDLLLAGHTHGGQVRIPGYGAVVTNCGIDRPRARGLSQWQDAALHVSAGLGTSPYAPVRFNCRPEATVLILTPRDAAASR